MEVLCMLCGIILGIFVGAARSPARLEDASVLKPAHKQQSVRDIDAEQLLRLKKVRREMANFIAYNGDEMPNPEEEY